MRKRHVALAVTGASGAPYALRLGRELLAAGCRVSLMITAAGFMVLNEECGIDWRGDEAATARGVEGYFGAGPGQLCFYREDDLLAPIASGSAAPDALAIVPCSMGTLARIACGNSGNLPERVADVMLKEGRPLVLVPRETPLNAIHLENMLKLARLGVRLVPAMPAFYQHPESVEDLVFFMTGKILDTLGIENSLFRRWGEH